MSQWDDELKDSWEGSGLAIPVIAWGDHRKGEGFEDAILLPTYSGRYVGKGYHQVPDMEPKEIPGPTGDFIPNPNYGKPKRFPNSGNIIPITVLTLLTDKQTLDFDGLVSEPMVKKIEAARATGDDDALQFLSLVEEWGLRRLYVVGGVLDPAFKAAVKASTGSPQPGALLSVLHDGKIPHPKRDKIKVNGFVVRYAPSNAASLARVEEYQRKAAPIVNKYLEANAPQEDAAPASASTSEKPRRPIGDVAAEAYAATSKARSAEEEPPF